MMEAELTRLKTSAQKSGAVMDLTTKSVSVSVPLVLGQYQTTAHGYAYYIAKSDGDNIVLGYLDWYSEDVQKNWIDQYRQGSVRQAWIDVAKYNGDILFKITVRGSRQDIDTLSGGSSVVANINMTLVGVKEFEVQQL